MKNYSKKTAKKAIRYRTPSTFRSNQKPKNYELHLRSKKTTQK
jgi:hypothetical protein